MPRPAQLVDGGGGAGRAGLSGCHACVSSRPRPHAQLPGNLAPPSGSPYPSVVWGTCFSLSCLVF